MNDIQVAGVNMLTAIAQGDLATAEAEGLKTPQVDCPVYHFFSPGLCVREVHLPAGSIIIGHVQKFAHLNIFLKGRLRMIQDGHVQELVAPMMFTGTPGRKVCYVVEDSIWQNIYPTELTDPTAVEEAFVDKSQTFQEDAATRVALQTEYKKADRDDFESLPADLRRYFGNLIAGTEHPRGITGVINWKSPISGDGLFATAKFMCNQHIVPLSVNGKWTPAARFLNHSPAPNCLVVVVGGQLWLMATAEVAGCTGGQPGSELTVDYRQWMTKIQEIDK